MLQLSSLFRTIERQNIWDLVTVFYNIDDYASDFDALSLILANTKQTLSRYQKL